MCVLPSSLGPLEGVPVRVVAQTGTPVPTTPVPTTTPPDATGGLGLAAALVALAFLGAVAVTAGGAIAAGWAAFRGSVLTLEVGPRQQRLFAVAAACFVLSLFAVLGGVGPLLGEVFVVVFGVGGVAAAVGIGWVVASNVRDWHRERG
jgi:hypothetical protein